MESGFVLQLIFGKNHKIHNNSEAGVKINSDVESLEFQKLLMFD